MKTLIVTWKLVKDQLEVTITGPNGKVDISTFDNDQEAAEWVHEMFFGCLWAIE